MTAALRRRIECYNWTSRGRRECKLFGFEVGRIRQDTIPLNTTSLLDSLAEHPGRSPGFSTGWSMRVFQAGTVMWTQMQPLSIKVAEEFVQDKMSKVPADPLAFDPATWSQAWSSAHQHALKDRNQANLTPEPPPPPSAQPPPPRAAEETGGIPTMVLRLEQGLRLVWRAFET